jgi:2-keto-4-pentenoate hydratase/2-oxohepta-3-ene-1,7-dioic acid hydratase in catechol pathway
LRILRYEREGEAHHGILRDGLIYPVLGDIFGAVRADEGNGLDPGSVRILAPVIPTKIVAVGINYRDHASELDHDVPEDPVLFMKPPSSVIGTGEPIICPPFSTRVDYEAELAAVVGRRTRNVDEKDALDHLLGYTCLNDVTERDLQRRDGQWTRAKSFDTFCPIGPWIETDLDPGDVRVMSRLNGEVRQSSSTANLIFPLARLIAFISRIMTLLPGDVVTTGTPSGVGPLTPGDTILVEVEGIGVLENPVIDGWS